MSEKFRNKFLSPEERAADILLRMTLHEKVMQLVQRPIGIDSNPNNASTWTTFNPLFGSILNFSGSVEERNAYQKAAVEDTRLGIPILWAFDVIHGYKTSFPVPLAQAATFDLETAFSVNAASNREARKMCGTDIVFAPMCEVCRDPRWGRIVESYGEDPYTVSRFTEAAVRGIQEGNPGMLACLKHFAGYSAATGGRDYSAVEIAEIAMQECYLPPFEAGVKAGAKCVMSGFNALNGDPVIKYRNLLEDILHGQWGFNGMVISDCNAAKQLDDQGYSSDKMKQAVASLQAGNDMDMVDMVYFALEDAVDRGDVSVTDIDRAVKRILEVKFSIGLFEKPYIDVQELPDYPEMDALALDAARKSAVLLKNENGLLPLKPAEYRKILLTGPAADDASCLIGSWMGAAKWDAEYAALLKDTAEEYFPAGTVVYRKSVGFTGEDDDPESCAAALAAAEECDMIIAALGENGNMSGEYRSRAFIGLPGRQLQFLRELKKTGKPVLVLLTAGRPLVLPEVAENCDAMLMLWQAGKMASRAAWDIVTGKVAPSGRLPVSFPRCEGQIPCHYNQRPLARRRFKEYIDLPDGALYPFGFGLSYADIVYGNLQVSENPDGDFIAEIELHNNSDIDTDEVVLWYISDPEAELTQPVKRLIGFSREYLPAHADKTIRLKIIPERDLSYPDAVGKRHLEAGKFVLDCSGKADVSFQFSRPEKK